MSKQNNAQVTTLALPVSADNVTGASNLIKKYIYHWPLFILTTIIAFTAAYFYIKVTNPIYPILSTLEFKAPTASSASLTVNQNSTEQQLNPIDKPVIVENEIEVMQSKKLIYQVVNQLELWVNYSQKKGLSTKDLYKATPVHFQFLLQNGIISPRGEKIAILIKDTTSFVYKDAAGVSKVYKFSSPVKSPFGTWQLTANANIQSSVGATINITVQDPDLVSDSYQGKIKVALENKDAPFVNLSTSDEIPQRGKDVLNSLMTLYLEYAIEDKNKLSQSTLKFIDSRLESLKTELDSVELQMEDYENKHNITDINSQAQLYRELNQDNMKSLNDVDVQLGVLSNLEKYANSNQYSERLPAVSGIISDPALIGLYEKLSDLQLKREQLLSTTPEKNPIFSSINEQIKVLKSDFRDKMQIVKSSLLAQKKQLSSFSKGVQSSLKSVPVQGREYASLQRIQISKENIYKFMLEKREQVALRYASSVSDSEVVDDAHAGKVKWPLSPIVYAVALIFGLALAAFVLFLKESLDDLITSRKQIEDELNVGILGELAYMESEDQIVVSEGRGKFAIGEQFRVLRTNLFHLHGNSNSGRVTLFTSSISGEGKSFVSSNLAVTLAYASRKTIILEMDLRKPKVSINFGLSSDHLGISDYLDSRVSDISVLIRPSGIPGLDVLSCGSILPNPSELLEKEKLDELITKLKEVYDDIIIDSPPIHLVTDALIIARVADASLYVVRQAYTHKYELDFVNDIIEANRFPKFSIVFNGVKRNAFGYSGYGYNYYGYGYSYYNSYSNNEHVSFSDKIKAFMKRFY
ncbi:MAG: GumC family protein [Mucilaginibacter sp.]